MNWMKPSKDMEKAYFAFAVIFILILSFIHSIPAYSNPSLGWDYAFYLFSLSNKTNLVQIMSDNTEPLYFTIFRPIASVFGDIQALQFSLFIMFFFLLFGFYLLCKQLKFKWYATLSVLVFLTFAPGINRIWFDEFRNFLAVAIFPYFIYFFFSKRKYSIYISILLITLMALAHRAFLLPLSAIVIFALVEKKYLIRMLKVFIPFAIITLLIINFGFGHKIASVVSTSFVSSVILPNITATFQDLYWFFFYNGIFIAPICFSLFYLKFDSNIKFWVVFLIGLTFAAILYDTDFGGRMKLLISIPAAMILGIFINQWDSLKVDKRHLITIILVAYTFAFLVFFGGYFLYTVTPTFSAKEADILTNFDVKDNYLLLSSRLDYASRYYSDVLPGHQLTTEWYNFTSVSVSDPKIQLFYGIGNWKQTARMIANGKDIYILWTSGDSIINQTTMNQRIENGEIRLILPNNGKEYLGELNYK